MRRLLLITFRYPPAEIIGAQRPRALAKYLPKFGWEVTVVTPRLPHGPRQWEQVIETEYHDILAEWKRRAGLDGHRGLHEQLHLSQALQPRARLLHTRILIALKNVLTYPDPTKGWISSAVQAIEQIRAQNSRVDAILTTSPPISCQLIGRKAKKILGCPWVADFRDLWTQNVNGSFQRLQTGLEKRTLRHADALVTVSGPWAARLRRRYYDKEICTICNGFDPEDFGSPPPPLTKELSITYTGQLYQGRRDPTPLFQVLHELINKRAISPRDVRIRFYGPTEPWILPTAQQYGLEEIVELNGVIPRSEALQRQRESHTLLLLGWADHRETGQHTGKLFEYLGAQRPILAVGGVRGVLTHVLEETSAGEHALCKEQLRNIILQMYAEYTSGGSVSYHGKKWAIDQYSHLEMARAFAMLLDRVIQTKGDERVWRAA